MRFSYLRPSWRYPAALAYQLATGVSIFCSQGRLFTKGARDIVGGRPMYGSWSVRIAG